MKKLWILATLLFASAAAAQTPTGTVVGQVFGRDGEPAAGVRVSAMAVPDADAPANSGTALLSIALTDREGHYRLDNVPPASYYILAGFVDLPTYYPGVASVANAKTVDVLSGVPVTGINFMIAASVGVTVSGRVVSSSGAIPLPGQRVAIIGGNSGIQESVTNADGSFQFLRVRPGTYQLASAATRPGGQPRNVTVGEEDVTGLEIVVVPTVEVTGTIAIESDAPRPRMNLQFAPFKGLASVPGTSTQNDGSFRTLLPEGNYRVTWSNLPVGYEIKSITSGTVDLLTTPLKAVASAPPSPLKVVLAVEGKPWIKLAGRITGVPAGQTIMLSGIGSDTIQIPVRSDGKFELDNVFPGNYTARINPPVIGGGAPNRIIVPDRDTTDFVIAMPPSKEVQGLVTDAAGVPVQTRLSMNYQEIRTNGSASGSFSLMSRADGRFTIAIMEGDRRAGVSVPGYTVKTFTYGTTDLLKENMSVTMSDNAELRVVLDGSATVTGGAVGTATGIGRVVGGVAGGGFTSSLAVGPPAAPVAAPPFATANRIPPDLAQANLVSSPPPAYPALAAAARVQGSVVLQLEISTEGKVRNVAVISGHPLLNEAAIQAVRQWTYKPFTLNGTVVPVVTTATVNFTLP